MPEVINYWKRISWSQITNWKHLRILTKKNRSAHQAELGVEPAELAQIPCLDYLDKTV